MHGGDRTLTGSTIATQSTLAGGGYALSILGDATIDGAYTNLSSLSISGTADLGSNVTTTGTQTYTGAVTLSGGSRTLTGATINTQSTLAGGGNTLTITGAADIDGAYTGLGNFSVTGAVDLGGNVTTSGTQIYGAAVTLRGGNRLLQSANSNIEFRGEIDGDVAGARALDIRAGTGTAIFRRSIGANVSLASLSTTALPNAAYVRPVGHTVLEADVGSVRTAGDQVYNDLTFLTNTAIPKDSGNTAVSVNTEDGRTNNIFPLRMTSSAGSLNFQGSVEGGVRAKTNMRSLFLEAGTSVTFNDQVGFDAVSGNAGNIVANYTRHFGVYRLDVTAPRINILGNITAYEHINLRGDAFIGGHTVQPQTRYVFSLDPAVNFFGKVDGYGLVDGIYTLDARAIGFDTSVIGLAPDSPVQLLVNFAADVGSQRALAGLNTQAAVVSDMTAMRGSGADAVGGEGARRQASVAAPIAASAGTVRFGGNVTTTGAQSHFANRFVVSGSGVRGTELNGSSFEFTIGSGGVTSADGGRPRIRFSNNPSGDTLSMLQRAGVSVTSLPNDSTPEMVMALNARKKHGTQAMDEMLDGQSSSLPVVEVGDLVEEECERDLNNECKGPAPIQR